MEKAVFQQFQFDKGISRLRKNPVEQTSGPFVTELGGDKTIGWEMRQKLGRIKKILLDNSKEKG